VVRTPTCGQWCVNAHHRYRSVRRVALGRGSHQQAYRSKLTARRDLVCHHKSRSGYSLVPNPLVFGSVLRLIEWLICEKQPTKRLQEVEGIVVHKDDRYSYESGR
jgi:hypothetical protein